MEMYTITQENNVKQEKDEHICYLHYFLEMNVPQWILYPIKSVQITVVQCRFHINTVFQEFVVAKEYFLSPFFLNHGK